MNTAALNTVYNHYLTSYAPKSTTQYDTHKKSELRSIYNSIVKQNKESPLCIVDTSKESQEFAVGIKENARELRNTIASLNGMNQGDALGKKIAVSSNEDIATAKFIGDSNTPAIPSFEIEVKKLAAPQTNTGSYLPSNDKVALEPDAYSFDIGINDLNYEFQFNVKETDTNLDLQKRLGNLINNAGIGLEANILEDGEGNSSLAVTSKITGLPAEKNALFQITDDKTSKRNGSVEYLGIGEITRPASNASFVINGSEKSALSNTFTVEKTFEVTLNGVSPEEGLTASIDVKADAESLKENVSHLIGSYNSFIKAASDYAQTQPRSGRLLDEMGQILGNYNRDLHQIGLSMQEDGTLSMNEKEFQNSIQNLNDTDETSADIFEPVKNFSNMLLRKANQVSLNPMDYVSKTIVAYKNPGHNFASPYVTSAYSGMMFNSYC